MLFRSRLSCPLCDHDVSLLRNCFGHQEFQFARFVAATRQAGAVIALDPQTWPTKQPRQVVHGLQWSREMTESDAWEAGEVQTSLQVVDSAY